MPTEIWSSRLRAKSRKSREAGGGGGGGVQEQKFQYVYAREPRRFFPGTSAKARESIFHTHGRRERKNPHRESFAKEMAKGKTE